MNFLNGLLFILNSEALGQLVGVVVVIAAGIVACFFLWHGLLKICKFLFPPHQFHPIDFAKYFKDMGVGPLPPESPRGMTLEPLSDGNVYRTPDPRHFAGDPKP